MAGGLDNLSADELRALSRTIEEAKELVKQQEQLLQRTIALEDQLAKKRVASLQEYNDSYSRLLNTVASETNILQREMYQVTQASNEAADAAERAVNSNNNQTSSGSRPVGQTLRDDRRGGLGDADKAETENIAARFADYAATNSQLTAAMDKRNQAYAESEKTLADILNNLSLARSEQSAALDLASAEMSSMTATAKAELQAQSLLNQVNAEREFLASEAGEVLQMRKLQAQEQQVEAEARQHAIQQIEAQRIKFIAQEELKLKRKNNRELTADEKADLIKRANDKYKLDEQNVEKLAKKQREANEKEEQRKLQRETEQKVASAAKLGGISTEDNLLERIKALNELSKDETTGEHSLKGTAAVIVKALSSIAQQLETQVDKIAESQGAVDTRLQGITDKVLETREGSYWDQLVQDMMSIGAVNPYFKQEKFADKIKEYVDMGIAFDLEQRAFLATITDKIATTFNAADATLLRLIRLQQEDSTAGRLGMEAALNAFLNEMYANTEYLKTVASSVRSSLTEMEALMDGASATEVEYQVQKWLGSLYSVGMSQEAVNSISSTLGQIAAGQIEGLTGTNGTGNLLVMAANKAGIPIADILSTGITADKTNTLLQAVVDYLAEIAYSTEDNNVVRQQLANVFGVKASDLKAATNLSSKGSINNIYDTYMSYDNMLYKLFTLAGSMGDRTSIGEQLTNVWGNVMYSLAGGIASTPAAYGILKAAGLLDDAVGGIDLPFISFAGTGVDLNTTIADLMRVGALGGGVLGSFGSLIDGLGNSFSGQAMLNQLGISTGSGLNITPRGAVAGIGSSGGGSKSISESGYVGNTKGSDIKDSTMQEAEKTKKQLMIEAQEEAEETQVDTINTTVLKIYEILDDVAHGNGCFRVKVEGYGLTKAGGGFMGGVNALDSLISDSGTGSGISAGVATGGLAGGGVNSGSAGGSINFGGWTTTG
jgi:hypothetical protein